MAEATIQLLYKAYLIIYILLNDNSHFCLSTEHLNMKNKVQFAYPYMISH